MECSGSFQSFPGRVGGQYVAGAYPCVAWVNQTQQRIRTLKASTSISYEYLCHHAKRGYGRLLTIMEEVEGSPDEALAKLKRPGVPARLDCGGRSPGEVLADGGVTERVMATLTLHLAAAFLHLHPVTLRDKARAGQIPAAKAGKRWLFLEVNLTEWLRTPYPARALQGNSLGEVTRCHSTNAKTVRIGGLIQRYRNAPIEVGIGALRRDICVTR